MNRQTNIYPSSIERELKRQQSLIGLTTPESVSVTKKPFDWSLMPQLKYGLGFSHQDVNEKLRKVSGNTEDSEPVIKTQVQEGSRSQGQVTTTNDARQKFRKLGQSLLKRSNTAQPTSTDASSSDQSSRDGGDERSKVKSLMSSEPASKRKHSLSSCGKGIKGLWIK